MTPLTLQIDRRIHAPVEVVWRAISNTDAFNRAAGLGFEFEMTIDTEGRVIRHGKARRFGQTLRWKELPFEFVAPDSYRSERLFVSGPVARVLTEVEIDSDHEASLLSYRVTLEPRSWLYRPIVATDLAMSTKPTLIAVVDGIVEMIESDRIDFDLPPDLGKAESAILDTALEAVEDLDIRRALSHLVRQAPLLVQNRIQPLRLAGQLELPLAEVLRGCIEATSGGALEVCFLLLCPACLGAKESVTSLDFTVRNVHCTTCNLKYDATLSDNIEVAFRTSRGLRREVPVFDCIQSPSFTPHVLGQASIATGQEHTLEMNLSPGCYRVEAVPRRGEMHIEVVDDGEHVVVADLTERGVFPRRAVLGAGMVRLHLRSRLSGAAVVSVARRQRPPGTLTVSRFLQQPLGARWALENQGLEGVPREAVLVTIREDRAWGRTDRTDEWVRELREHGARHAQLANGVAIAVVDSIEDAVSLAEGCIGENRTVAMAAGSVLLLERADGMDVVVGRAVDDALATLQTVGWGRIAVHSELVEDARFARWLAEAAASVELVAGWGARPALLRFPEAPVSFATAPPGPMPTSVGSYKLGVELGSGGMGQVFEARHTETGERVVVKLLRDSLYRDFRFVTAFYNEARLGWTVQHPHVVRVLDWGSDPDSRRLFLVMEYLEGRTLAEQCKTAGVLSTEATLRLARQLLDGLAAIHDAGVVHRDVKPENVLLTARGAVLLDFGIAHREDTELPAPAGSHAWVSPEALEGRTTDARSDLYQLALLLCRVSTGSWPYPGRSPAERSRWREQHKLETLPTGLPLELESVVLKALQGDPAARFSNAREMRQALIPQVASTEQ